MQRFKKMELIEKPGISRFTKNCDLNEKISTLATKGEFKAVHNKIEKLEIYMTQVLFIGQNYLGNDGLQNFLIFQEIHKTFKISPDVVDTEI